MISSPARLRRGVEVSVSEAEVSPVIRSEKYNLCRLQNIMRLLARYSGMIYYYVNVPTITPSPKAWYSGINSPRSCIIHYRLQGAGIMFKKVCKIILVSNDNDDHC